MGTALAQYFGMLTIMDCTADMIYAAFAGFVGGVLLTAVINMIINDTKK